METDRKFSETSVKLGAAEAFRLFLDENALKLPAGQKPISGVENIYQAIKSIFSAVLGGKTSWRIAKNKYWR